MKSIENVDELIRDYISSNKRVIDKRITNLTLPGENYVSEVVRIHVILKDNNTNIDEDLHLVAKLPTNNERMFTPDLIKNEIIFYKEVIPVLKSFHQRRGLAYPNYFAEFVGGRINLTGSKKADQNAVLILENLKEKGYENVDRCIGFDLETSKLILSDLATFHAAILAMKLKEPEVFESEIRSKYENQNYQEIPKEPNSENNSSACDSPESQTTQSIGLPIFFYLLLDLLKGDPKYSSVVADYEIFLKKIKNKKRPNQNGSAFLTLKHTDMWINNTLQIFKDGAAVSNKFIDFPNCEIGSPVHDLIFFLFSSVQLICLKENLDSLLKYYHSVLVDILNTCHCDEADVQFSYKKFLEEITEHATTAIQQSIFMISSVIFINKGEVFDFGKVSTMTIEEMPQMAKEKLMFLCWEASRRGWF